jgi:pyruvate-formate lyase-activating enzyme
VELSLLITSRCNASCAHCSTNCGPYRTESLPHSAIFKVMDQAAELSGSEPPEFYLSGGEPFLDFEGLLEIVAYGKRLGGIVTCVTNGYWATSEEKAHSMLSAVQRAGLAELAVSSSRFHEKFVSRRRVGRVLGAARALGLRCTLKHVHSRSDRRSRRTVSSWAKTAGAAEVQEISLLPHLRTGEKLPEGEFPRRKGLPGGVCPARLLSVNEDGKAYTCCTPGGFTDLLALGSVHETRLEDLRDRFYLGGTQQILRRHGPRYFARDIEARGLGGRLRKAYGGICDLCTHIASDPVLAVAAADASKAFEVRQVENLLGSMIDNESAVR